jgi:hypothetical protein
VDEGDKKTNISESDQGILNACVEISKQPPQIVQLILTNKDVEKEYT